MIVNEEDVGFYLQSNGNDKCLRKKPKQNSHVIVAEAKHVVPM